MIDPSPFVPDDFIVPRTLTGPGFRLEPLGPEHNERDHAAWMGSIDHIRSTPGFPSRGDWPSTMDLAANRGDLEGHAADFADRSGFTYTVLAAAIDDGTEIEPEPEAEAEADAEAEAEVIGCVYLYPGRGEADVDVRSWVVADRADLDTVLWRTVRAWLEADWPFTAPDYAPRP